MTHLILAGRFPETRQGLWRQRQDGNISPKTIVKYFLTLARIITCLTHHSDLLQIFRHFINISSQHQLPASILHTSNKTVTLILSCLFCHHYTFPTFEKNYFVVENYFIMVEFQVQ